jgi:hypothetical protein
MNLRSTDGGARIRSGLALLAMASTALLLSPVAQAQHMHGSGGMQRGGHIAGASHFNRGSGNFTGGRHNGVAARGFHHHRGFASVVVIGGAGFWYPYAYPYYTYTYAYPYGYDPALATPTYNMAAPAPFWYFCEAANAYYPYVTTCAGGWKVVPATPDQADPVPQQ